MGLNTDFARSPLADDDLDRIPSEAANTDLTTVSPTPPLTQQITNNVLSEPYSVMYLSPPTRSSSDIFDIPYSNTRNGNIHEKVTTFGTLPANNTSSGSSCNRYSYEYMSRQTNSKLVYIESPPKIDPPRLPRRTVSTFNSNNSNISSSYM